ncbi:CHAT domain-containing protein [Candidatus Albibeggiatoa sp. nov. NOAA]|uniref:CHAT domain-containing protein n=1 Tax=Candidatus Albibeggiatoa sp. nov. NOAA TaxID=3162724 RepID=UPI0032F46E59|nr:CHAT domain-containing protein [Thiotrichaceae bacterium]
MPQSIAQPFIIRPDTQLIADHPQLVSLAKQLSIKYVHDHIVSDEHLQQVGALLWQALNIEADLNIAKQVAGTQILPIVIDTNHPALFSLPWECLFHPQDGFLAKHPRYTISRQWRSETQLSDVPKGALQVLLFTSQPDDLDAEKARLDIETEQVKVLEALGNAENEGKVQLTILDDGRFSTLKQTLRTREFHLVFLSGHGMFKAEAFSDDPAEAYFLFEGENGLGEQISGQEIAQLFCGTRVQCVVLSACQSGKMSSDDLNASLTTRLVQNGVPHVIGMRESVSDVAATVFTEYLCRALVNQDALEVAVQQAREKVSDTNIFSLFREVSGKQDESYGQWNLPHLISLQPSRPLIDWDFEPRQHVSEQMLVESLQNIRLPKRFIGRRKELRELGQALFSDKLKQLLITGAGGQGKTALAGQLARKLEQQGYLVLAYSARPEDSDWQQFLFEVQLGLEPRFAEILDKKLILCKNATQQAQLYLQILLQQSQQKLVLFFDNLESVQTEDGVLQDEHLQAWITVAQRLNKPILLLTSRWCLPEWSSPQHHVLARPSYGDFLRYLKALDSERDKNPNDDLRKDMAVKRELYQKIGGNFKGLELYHAAESQAGFDRQAFLDKLVAVQVDLQAFMAVEQVVAYLTVEQRTLLEHLTVYHTPVMDMGVSKISQDLAEPMVLLKRLVALSLVDVARSANGELYQVTPLVGEWLNNRESLPMDLREKAAKHQLWVFENLHKTLSQAIITHEAFVFAQLQEKANQFALDKIVGQLIHIGMYQQVLTEWLPRLRESDKQEIKAEALGYSGLAHDNLGDYDNASNYYEQSLSIRQEIGDRSGEGTTLNNISQIYSAKGDYETALGYLKQSLSIRQEIGDRSGEGTTLNNMSTIAYAKGDYETALGYLKQSLAISNEIGDVINICRTTFNIGHIHLQNEEQQEAVECWVKAYLIANKIGWAELLEALDNLAKQLGGTGLETWEQLAQQLNS